MCHQADALRTKPPVNCIARITWTSNQACIVASGHEGQGSYLTIPCVGYSIGSGQSHFPREAVLSDKPKVISNPIYTVVMWSNIVALFAA